MEAQGFRRLGLAANVADSEWGGRRGRERIGWFIHVSPLVHCKSYSRRKQELNFALDKRVVSGHLV